MLKSQSVLFDLKLFQAKFRDILETVRAAVKWSKTRTSAVVPSLTLLERSNDRHKMTPPSAKLIPVVTSSSPRFVKWAIVGFVTSALGYWLLRQYRWTCILFFNSNSFIIDHMSDILKLNYLWSKRASLQLALNVNWWLLSYNRNTFNNSSGNEQDILSQI